MILFILACLLLCCSSCLAQEIEEVEWFHDEPVSRSFPPVEAVSVDSAKVSALLKDVRDAQMKNVNLIQTWHSRCEGRIWNRIDRSVAPKSLLTDADETNPKARTKQFDLRRDFDVAFVSDSKRDMLRSEYEVSGICLYRGVGASVEHQKMQSPFKYHCICREGDIFVLNSDRVVGELLGYPQSTVKERPFTRVIERAERPKGVVGFSGTHQAFDPWCVVSGSQSLATHMNKIVEVADRHPSFLKCWSVDDNVVCVSRSFRSTEDARASCDYVFRKENNYLPSRIVFWDNEVRLSDVIVEYRRVNSMVVPERAVLIEWRPQGEFSSMRLVQFLDSTINEPIDDNEFDLQAFGLDEGDRIRDSRTNTLHVLSHGEWLVVSPEGAAR